MAFVYQLHSLYEIVPGITGPIRGMRKAFQGILRAYANAILSLEREGMNLDVFM